MWKTCSVLPRSESAVEIASLYTRSAIHRKILGARRVRHSEAPGIGASGVLKKKCTFLQNVCTIYLKERQNNVFEVYNWPWFNNAKRSSGSLVVKLLAFGGRCPGFESRFRHYHFREWESIKLRYDWKATYFLKTIKPNQSMLKSFATHANHTKETYPCFREIYHRRQFELSWVYRCFTSHATIFQSYMWRHKCAGGLNRTHQKSQMPVRYHGFKHEHFAKNMMYLLLPEDVCHTVTQDRLSCIFSRNQNMEECMERQINRNSYI